MGYNAVIGLSGGPSVVINATLAGVLREAFSCSRFDRIYGLRHGIQGALDDDLIDLSPYADEHSLRLLEQTPAMALGSCRRKLKPEDYPRIDEVFASHNITDFFYIGGNDSMDTVAQLSRHWKDSGIRAVGIPKTIDNDLCVTDHTPGYGSSAKYLYTTMAEIIRDSEIYPVKNVVIVEIMGRDSGWLTLAAGMPAFMGGTFPQIVALPETPFDEFGFLNKIRAQFDAGQRTVVCAVSEGVRTHDGTYVGAGQQSGAVDAFGHSYLSGVGKYLEYLVMDKIGCKVRSIELNVMQRCSAHLMARTDHDEAVEIGKSAVRAALDGKTGVMMAYRRLSDTPYQVEIIPVEISKVANLAKDVPERWWNLEDPAVQKEIVDYILPLMRGEMDFLRDENGFLEYLTIR